MLAWLLVAYIGFGLLLWPFTHGGVTLSFDNAGPAFWFAGDFTEDGAAVRVILYAAALIGLVTVTLQIAYLPTLYSAFNRRETDVALLNARAGVPSWGPELLARTHYALGSGASTINTLPDLYDQWERWAADIAESHTTYLPLVRFRSPRPLSSWVTALLAVLDSAAMYLALSPESAPTVAARLCLRGGFQCFTDVARAMGLHRAGDARSRRGHQPDLRGLPGGDRDPGEGELPDRAHARRRVAGLRRLAGQLRAGRLRRGQGRRRGPGAVVGPAAPSPESRSRPSARGPDQFRDHHGYADHRFSRYASSDGAGRPRLRRVSSMAEQRTFNPSVLGSSPRRATTDQGFTRLSPATGELGCSSGCSWVHVSPHSARPIRSAASVMTCGRT